MFRLTGSLSLELNWLETVWLKKSNRYRGMPLSENQIQHSATQGEVSQSQNHVHSLTVPRFTCGCCRLNRYSLHHCCLYTAVAISWQALVFELSPRQALSCPGRTEAPQRSPGEPESITINHGRGQAGGVLVSLFALTLYPFTTHSVNTGAGNGGGGGGGSFHA